MAKLLLVSNHQIESERFLRWIGRCTHGRLDDVNESDIVCDGPWKSFLVRVAIAPQTEYNLAVRLEAGVLTQKGFKVKEPQRARRDPVKKSISVIQVVKNQRSKRFELGRKRREDPVSSKDQLALRKKVVGFPRHIAGPGPPFPLVFCMLD